MGALRPLQLLFCRLRLKSRLVLLASPCRSPLLPRPWHLYPFAAATILFQAFLLLPCTGAERAAGLRTGGVGGQPVAPVDSG